MYFKPTLLASALLFASLNVHAELTSYNPNGVELVYSSISDVTWTKDANLLASLISSQGHSTIVDAIIAVTPTITNTPNVNSPLGIYTLSAADFSENGRTSWWGALGFVNYLNSVSYGGSDQWRLPTVATSSDEFPELFFQELGGTAWRPIPNTATFDNEQSYTYWSGAEYSSVPSVFAWVFGNHNGFQGYGLKEDQRYAWVVTSGLVAAVPEADIYAMLLVGLGLLGAVMRRRHAK
ncbi:DUF1566 domain-containing protein [Methylobacillus methanolivorans]|uniref:DUF1566 domain-containing protein n=1 Tax=Methylobacillus methanolivorans TaxID=1848927 RepID=A0ABW8GL03_9PROT